MNVRKSVEDKEREQRMLTEREKLKFEEDERTRNSQ